MHDLRQHGFTITKDASQADYIIAHSGGIIFIPKQHKAKVMLLVGVNDKIDGPWLHTQYRKVKQDFVHALRAKRHWYWLKKSCWNTFYIIGKLKRSVYMLRFAHENENFIPEIKNAKVIVIHYKDDPWSDSLSKKDLVKFPQYQLITHTGLHDDLWMNPEYYIKLLL